jgi:hypothetical protein
MTRGIKPQVEGNKISFTLAAPGQITIEVNDEHQALHLFANPPERGAPAPGTPGCVFFGPGIHRPGLITIEKQRDGFTWRAERSSNASFSHMGRKSASGRARHPRREHLQARRQAARCPSWLSFSECKNIEVEGIILRDPPVWAASPNRCEGVRFTTSSSSACWRYNSDGYDFVDCRDVIVKDSFVRSFDDSIVVKVVPPRAGPYVRDILVENLCHLTDWGFSLGVTYETRADHIRGHRLPQLRRHPQHHLPGRADDPIQRPRTISNVRFEDIRVEDAAPACSNW